MSQAVGTLESGPCSGFIKFKYSRRIDEAFGVWSNSNGSDLVREGINSLAVSIYEGVDLKDPEKARELVERINGRSENYSIFEGNRNGTPFGLSFLPVSNMVIIRGEGVISPSNLGFVDYLRGAMGYPVTVPRN